MTIDRLRAALAATGMQVKLTREERALRASLRNAAETERRCRLFLYLKQGAKVLP